MFLSKRVKTWYLQIEKKRRKKIETNFLHHLESYFIKISRGICYAATVEYAILLLLLSILTVFWFVKQVFLKHYDDFIKGRE